MENVSQREELFWIYLKGGGNERISASLLKKIGKTDGQQLGGECC